MTSDHYVRRSNPENSMATFIDFRDGVAGDILRRKLGLGIGDLETWEGYTRRVVMLDDRDGFLARVRRLDGLVSSGERTVAHACLAAADFEVLVEELDGGLFWRRFDTLDREHALAVAAVIVRRDAQRDASMARHDAEMAMLHAAAGFACPSPGVTLVWNPGNAGLKGPPALTSLPAPTAPTNATIC